MSLVSIAGQDMDGDAGGGDDAAAGDVEGGGEEEAQAACHTGGTDLLWREVS